MKNLILFLAIVSINTFSHAQTGPGGVGNSDGTNGQPRNMLWVDAQKLTVSNADDVSTWADLSGNGYGMSSDGSDPSLAANIPAINGKNVVRFDNSNNEVLNFDANFNTEIVGTNYTFFWVASRTSNDNEQYVFGGSNGSTNQNLYSGWGYPGNPTNPALASNQWGNNCAATWGNYDTDAIGEFGIVTSTLNATDRYLFENGAQIATAGSTNQLTAQANTQLAYRGGSGNDYGDVDIAELVFFTDDLNTAQRIIIENYLNTKYNLALDANDYYSNSDGYDNELVGIGTTDGTIQHDATSGSGGAIYLEEANGSLDAANEYLMAAHDGTLHGGVNKDVDNALNSGRFERIWYIDKTGDIDATIKFDLVEAGFSAPSDVNDHVLLYRAGTSGDFTEVTVNSETINGDKIEYEVANANLHDGYYTLGVPESRDWYTLISGDWDDSETWTLDPSGALPDNPDDYTPSTSPTANFDNVYILSGRNITISSNNAANSTIVVDGQLSIGTTTGHSFTTIRGSGRIVMAADNFPTGDATHFVSQGYGEGTVVFEGTTYTIANTHEFYNVEIDLDDKTEKITLTNDLTINGDFTIQTGEFQINDNSSTTVLNLFVNNDILIAADGKILVGTGNTYTANSQYHQFTVKGDFNNQGIAKLTNRAAADYNNDDTGGATELIFNNTGANQTLRCDSTSVFNQITTDKGNDDTYILDVTASNSTHFKLYGRNDQAVSGDPGERDGNKALRLLAGTLKLGSNIEIPNLANDNSYDIDSDARLWINNATVTKPDGSGNDWLAIYGKLQISGTSVFTEETSYGTILRTTGTMKIEGGTVNLNVVRTSVWAGDHVGAYIQTGGNVTIKNESSNGDFASFHLGYEGNIFQMSGGTLTVEDQGNSGDGDDFAIIINSDPGNHNVTGGTVIVDMIWDEPYQITSKAPFYNFIVRNLTGTSPGTLTIMDYVDGGSHAVPSVAAQPLVVLNDFTIEQNTFLDHNGNDVTIGGDFSIHEDALQIGTNNYGYLYDAAKPNTTTFNGNDDATFYIGHNDGEANGWELYMNRLILNKPSGKTLYIDSDPENDVNNNPNPNARILRLDSTKVQSGILNQTDYSIRLVGNIINYDQIGVYEASTHDDALIMLAWSSYDIETSDNSIFGNVKVNTGNNIVSFSSNVYVKRIYYRHGRINAGTHNIKVDKIDYGFTNETQFDWDQDGSIQGDEQGVLSPMDLFIFAGNVSDGGLSLKITGNGNYTFPIGIGTDATELLHNTSKYTPAEVTVSNYSDDGYITIKPVDAELQTTDLSGGDILSYYWNVDYEGFTTEPTVEYKFYYYEDDLDGSGNESSFVPGKVLDGGDYARSYENDNTQVSDAGAFNASGVLGKNPGTNGILNEIEFNDHDNGSNGFTLENANYTAGETNRFTGEVEVYYSIATNINDCNWNDGDSWTRNDLLNSSYENHDSRQPDAGSDYPQEGDVAVIGWCPWDNTGLADIDPGDPHLIRLDLNIECAQLVFTPMEDASGNPRAREPRYATVFRPCLGIYSGRDLTTGLVEGEGMFWCKSSDPDFSLMDLGEFAVSDSSYVLYENYNSSRTYVNMPAESPNLMITSDSWGRNDHTTIIATDIKTNGSFEIIGDANVQLSTGASGDITVGGNLAIIEVTDPDAGTPSGGGGELRFQNSGNARTITVSGDILLKNEDNSIYVQSPSANNIAHQISVGGDISQTETGNGLLFSTGIGNDHIDLTLNGDGNNSFNITAGSIPEFHRIIMNKGTDQTSSFTFNGDFNLNGTTSGVNVDKALELQNGTLTLNHADIDINLNTGGDNFQIPSSSALVLNAGKASVSGNSGILLDGSLTIDGGQLDMRGGDNYIEYSASGNAELNMAADTLFVGSQIRRGLTATEGILKYNQTGGVVILGTDEAPENDRGVLEILNAGSEFNLTDGKLFIARAQSNPEIASLYLDPDNYNLEDNGKIYMGYSTTPFNQEIGIYSLIDLPYLKVDNSSGQLPTVKQWVVPLTIGDSLVVDAGAEFNADGRDLYIKGDMVVNGTFTPNGNTTDFNGSAQQEITGSPTFYNLTKSTATTLALNDDVTVNNVFSMPSGTLVDNDNTFAVKGNINFGGTHTWGGSGNGIVLNGGSEQIMTGAGTYGLLAIDNAEGVSIDHGSGSGITITSELQLNEGILDIDQYLLALQTNAEITTSSSFDANTLIQTNISFTDAGIIKYFPAFAVADPTKAYEFPVGVEGKYTPVAFTVETIDAGGSLRIKAANEMQPTINDDDDECNDFNDLLNVLQYHWILEATNITNFTADMTMEYDPSDALHDNPHGYDLTDYIAARILTYGTGADLNTWNKYDETNVDEANNQLTFSFSGTNSDGISGDYTAGVEQTDVGGCNGAIPNTVTEFITLNATNSWNDPNDWAIYDSETDTHGAAGDGVPASGPRGAVIFVDAGHTLTIPDNYISAYKTKIEAGATLDVGTTFGHRLGIVTGTGTLYLERGDLPAGIYDDFFSSSGGTLEFFSSSSEYYLNITEVNNLVVNVSSAYFPNNDVIINGDFTLKGRRLYNWNTTNVYLYGDLQRITGAFRFGHTSSYNSTIVFCSGTDQNIIGDFNDSGSQSMANMQVDKSGGSLTLAGNINLQKNLILTNGLINTASSAQILMSSSSLVSGGSASSHINGPLKKSLISGSNFTFPIGKDGYYRQIEIVNTEKTADWTAEYSPSNSISDVNTDDIATISNNDTWTVTAENYSGTQSAQVTLHWGTETNVSDDPANYSDLLVAYLDAGNVWQSAGYSGHDNSGTVDEGWVTSGTAVPFSTNTFTIASSSHDNPLPVSLLSFDALVTENNEVQLKWTTATETNNDYFIIERSADGVVFNEVARVSGAGNSAVEESYTSIDRNPLAGISYYRLRQVDFDGKEEIFPMVAVEIQGLTLSEPRLNIHPNPFSGGNILVDIDGFDKTQDAHVMLADVSGNSVWSGRMAPTREQMTKTLQPQFERLKPGFYIIVVVSNDRKISTRVVKK